MSLLPGPRTLRSRWSTLVWAAGICLLAASVAHQERGPLVDAAGAPANAAAQANALAAEDTD